MLYKRPQKFILILCGLIILSIVGNAIISRHRSTAEIDLITDWHNFMLMAETDTEGFRFPITARFYAYAGIAAYATVNSQTNNNYLHINEIFTDLQSLPKRDNNIETLQALNACYAEICQLFFIGGKNDLINKNRILFKNWKKKLEGKDEMSGPSPSEKFGIDIARAIYDWSATDTLAHRAELSIYDRTYKFDTIPGKWRSSVRFPMPPMLPYWGKTRKFLANSSDLIAPPPTNYSSNPNSIFYKEALEIYALHNPLSQENKWIAEFWDDDHPGQVFSHPGHWIAITMQVFKKEKPPLDLMIETLFKLGLSLSDAAVNCWNSKYTYMLERPEHYIQRYIDADWEPFGVSPSHPSYPSGHSAFGAAAAEVLTHYFGDTYKMTDKSLEQRKIYKVKSRKFNSFREMATENSISRMYLGVHYKSDCEEGRKIGEKVGKTIVEFPVRLSETHSLAN